MLNKICQMEKSDFLNFVSVPAVARYAAMVSYHYSRGDLDRACDWSRRGCARYGVDWSLSDWALVAAIWRRSDCPYTVCDIKECDFIE